MFNFFNETSYTFEGKKTDEKVVLFLHRHWFTLSGKFTFLTVLALLPVLLLLIFGQLILAHNLIPLFTFFWSAYAMMLWFGLFYSLTMYSLDYWIITDERVVDNIQYGFFNRKISELSIHMIQDVSVKLVGVLPTFFNYGTVLVQTAAQEGNFTLEQVPNPQQVKDTLMSIIDRIEDELGPHIRGLDRTHYFNTRANRARSYQPDDFVSSMGNNGGTNESTEGDNPDNGYEGRQLNEPVNDQIKQIEHNGNNGNSSKYGGYNTPTNLPL